ncbi:hypothetical protein CRE_22826 [Caenorhabditis remanei]|uniref:Domain of unknown function WSN domain-containing protein n=1 Tax=Caenorhabditis remanei TaxID=31234 RepID=E3MHF8_CAERE|nr:hypothetical protein CRE_22826 [Caenorhabditis remanei]
MVREPANLSPPYEPSESLSSAYAPRPTGYRPRYQRATNYDFPYKQAGLDELSFANGVSQNEDFNSIIQKLSMTARVVSALSLQNGLSDGSIPVDDVIAELLNIESADLKGLEAFDKKKVDDFVDNIYGVQLDENSKILDEGFRDVFMIRKIWTEIGGEKGLDGLPDDATYKELESLKKLDTTPLASLPLDRLITQLSTFSSLNEQAIGTLKSELSNILNSIDKLAASSDFPKYIAILDRLKPIGPFAQMVDLYNTLPEFIVPNKKNEIDSALLNFKNLKAVPSNSDSDSSSKTMRSVITSRLFHHSMTRLHSAGFVNGFEDLRCLKDDVKDDWLLNQINPSIDMKGFGKFDQLEEPMKEMDKKWIKMSTENAYNVVNRLAGVHTLLNSQTTAEVTESHLKTEIEAVGQRTKIRIVQDISTKQSRISERAGILNNKLTSLSLINSMANQMKESINGLSKKTSPENARRILQFLQGLKSQLTIVASGPAFKDVDMDTSQPVYIIDIKSNPSTKACIDTFKQMQEMGSEFDEVAQAAMASIEVRELIKAGDVTKTMTEVTLALSDSSGSLASIRKVLDTWKADRNGGDKQQAEQLKDLPKLSRSFGEGVNALVMAKKASEKEADFNLLIKNGFEVEPGVKTLSNPTFFEGFKAKWGDFDATASGIITMLARIDGWMSKVKAGENQKLSDFAPIFTGLEKIDDVDLLTDARLSAISLFGPVKAPPELKDVLPEFKKSLLELSKLDLKFSRFQSSVNQMPDTLKQLSAVLGSNSLQSSTTVPQGMVGKDGSDSESLWKMVWQIGGGTVFVLLICCVAFYAFVFCKRKDEKFENWWRKMTCGCFGKKKENTKEVYPAEPDPPVAPETPVVTPPFVQPFPQIVSLKLAHVPSRPVDYHRLEIRPPALPVWPKPEPDGEVDAVGKDAESAGVAGSNEVAVDAGGAVEDDDGEDAGEAVGAGGAEIVGSGGNARGRGNGRGRGAVRGRDAVRRPGNGRRPGNARGAGGAAGNVRGRGNARGAGGAAGNVRGRGNARGAGGAAGNVRGRGNARGAGGAAGNVRGRGNARGAGNAGNARGAGGAAGNVQAAGAAVGAAAAGNAEGAGGQGRSRSSSASRARRESDAMRTTEPPVDYSYANQTPDRHEPPSVTATENPQDTLDEIKTEFSDKGPKKRSSSAPP